MKLIRLLKRELPAAVVIVGDDGRERIMQVSPAKEGKLSAYMTDASEVVKRFVERLRRRQ